MFGLLTCFLLCSFGLYCCDPSEEIIEIVEPVDKATSAVIFLHGAGGSGNEIRGIVEKYIGNFSQYPNTRFIFPTASPVTMDAFPWNGQIINMWFSFDTLRHSSYSVNTTEMENSIKKIERLIEQQVASGIPHRNICLVGYSSGGMMSMYFGYGYLKNLGCIGAISAYVSSGSDLFEKINNQENNSCVRIPPLYIYAGGLDILTFPYRVRETANRLKDSGVPVTHLFQWTGTHYVNHDGVKNLFEFIKKSIL